MNPVGIIMYIVSKVQPTMNTRVQGIIVHPVHMMLEVLPVHIINILLMEKIVSPVIVMYIMNTVWVTMMPTIQVITDHQHIMLKDLPVHTVTVMVNKILNPVMVILVKENVNPVMFVMHVMSTVRPTMNTIPRVSHVTVHQHINTLSLQSLHKYTL